MASTLEEAFTEALAEAGPDPAAGPPEAEVDTPQPEAGDTATPESEPDTTEDSTDFPFLDDEEPEPDLPPAAEGDEPEPEPGQDDDTDAETPRDAINVTDEANVVLPDGTEVSGKELREGWLRQADYTRKTQQVAEQRKELEQVAEQVEEWFSARQANPAGWVAEIASQSEDATAVIAKAILDLAQAGRLDPDFVQTFGVESGPIAETAQRSETEDRVAKLEAELAAEREAKKRDSLTQQLVSEYQRQWDSIKTTESLRFAGTEQEQQAKIALLKYARDNEITSLEKAYAAMAYERQRRSRQQERAQVAQRKRQTAAVSSKSGTNGAAPPQPSDLDAAVRASLAELKQAGRAG